MTKLSTLSLVPETLFLLGKLLLLSPTSSFGRNTRFSYFPGHFRSSSVHHIRDVYILSPVGFHTYSYRVFMYNEFEPIKNFDAGAPFASGMELLKFYSFDTVDVSRLRPRHLTTLHPLTMLHPLTRWAATSAPSSALASSSTSASPSSCTSSTPDVAEGWRRRGWGRCAGGGGGA